MRCRRSSHPILHAARPGHFHFISVSFSSRAVCSDFSAIPTLVQQRSTAEHSTAQHCRAEQRLPSTRSQSRLLHFPTRKTACSVLLSYIPGRERGANRSGTERSRSANRKEKGIGGFRLVCLLWSVALRKRNRREKKQCTRSTLPPLSFLFFSQFPYVYGVLCRRTRPAF